jgi:hypothetical protein
MLVLSLVIGLTVLFSRAAHVGPELHLDGELHHLWAGPVTAHCTLQLAAVDEDGEAGDTPRRWELPIDVESSHFQANLAHDVLGEQAQWLALAVWCPALDAEPTRFAPRLLLDPTAPEPAQADTSPWLCVVPHGAAHGEFALRGATLTLYATVRRVP